MKKKLLALACISTMLFGMTAYAAESPTTDTDEAYEELVAEVAETATSSVSGDVSVTAVDDTTIASAEKIVEDTTLLSAIATSESVTSVSSADVVLVFDLEVEATAAELKAGVTVTLEIPEYSSSKNYTLIHYVDGAWEVVEGVEVKNGKISGVFYSFSPVAIVEYTVATTTATTATTTTTTTTTSPSTGNSSLPYAVSVLGLAVVALVAMKKRSAI